VELAPQVKLPDTMHLVRQRFTPTVPVGDVGAALCTAASGSPGFAALRPGDRIAVAVGSRGIDRLADVVAAVVVELRARGAEPFVVPAMGSHGAGSPEGQEEVLASYGITCAAVGAPVRSQSETVALGRLTDGTVIECDRLAREADGIVVVNRVKPHTSFSGVVESGLTKMLVLGLGKGQGARALHRRGFEALADRLVEAAPVALAHAPVLVGVALVEDARHRLVDVTVVEPDRWLEQEKELLVRARALMPRLPLKELDVLVVGRMGKDISGAGMDPHIINRSGSPAFVPAPWPRVARLAVLDLTDASHGNATGLGVADVTSRRLVGKIDFSATYANALTAGVLAAARVPLVARNDREAVAVAVASSGRDGEMRLAYLESTLAADEIWVSTACLEQLDTSSTRVEEEGVLRFDGGALTIDKGAA